MPPLSKLETFSMPGEVTVPVEAIDEEGTAEITMNVKD
jgi:hypothetical protein